MINQYAEDIIKKIGSEIQRVGLPHSRWYVGIAENPKERVFGAHSVSEELDIFFICKANSAEEARIAENELLKKGCDGGSGGGNQDSIWVYAYLKSNRTNP